MSGLGLGLSNCLKIFKFLYNILKEQKAQEDILIALMEKTGSNLNL